MSDTGGSGRSRGRGAGRGKDLTPNERVNRWVRDREARRLNKLRWAGREQSDVPPATECGDGPPPALMDTGEISDSSQKLRSKPGVQVYVPPSLRAKKGLTPARESPLQVETTVNNEERRLQGTKSSPSSDAELSHIPSRGRGRGRSKKKPEVEIYVPRALRAAAESKKSSREGSLDKKSADAESKKSSKDNSPDKNSENLNIEEQACSSDIIGETDNLNVNTTLHSTSERDSFHDAVCGNISLQQEPDSFTSHETATGISFDAEDGATHNEKSSAEEESYTFEFYDPAVIAFMPSSSKSSLDKNVDTPSTVLSGYLAETVDALPRCTAPCPDNMPLCSPAFNNQISENIFLPSEPTGSEISANGRRNSLPMDILEQSHSNKIDTSDVKDIKLTNIVQENSGLTNNEQVSLVVVPCDSSEMKADVKYSANTSLSVKKDDEALCQPVREDEDAERQSVPTPTQKIVNDAETEMQSVPALKHKIVNHAERQSVPTTKHKVVNDDEEAEVPKQKILNDEEEDIEDSWDAMFDDNGDCIDESVMEELVQNVGQVEVDTPKINYLKFEPKEPDMNFQEFSHIVEIYDFSPDLATCDLVSAFREFAARGFDVKWVDDTHALGVFSSTVAANEALRMVHPMMKVRPMSQASRQALGKARHCHEFLQPYKPRPQTTSLTARRLVAGALGMAPKVSREVRDKERQKLKEAKEKRRQEKQQKVDIWDGNFGKCAMDE